MADDVKILRLKSDIFDDRYLLRSANLTDLDNIAQSRTSLGLVAGGSGDIWVEKAGDTMTGQLNLEQGLQVDGTISIGDGGVSSNKILNIDKTIGDSGGYGFFSITRIDPTAEDSNFYFGGYLSGQTLSGNTEDITGGIRALKAFGEHNGTGTIGSIYGAEFQVTNNSSGTISQAVAFKILNVSNGGGGTISEYIGIELETPSLGRSIVARGGEIVFNDFSNTEADFTVRGDTVYQLFQVDTSADKVYIRGLFETPFVYTNNSAGTNRGIQFQSNFSARWAFIVNGTAESGSNAGSDFAVNRYSDAGSYLDTPMGGIRSTGQMLFGNFNSGFDSSGNLGIGTGFSTPASELEVVGTIQADGLRLDVTPTSETISPTHTITISVSGTDYKIPVVAA